MQFGRHRTAPNRTPIDATTAPNRAGARQGRGPAPAAELRTIDEVENFFSTAHDAFTADKCRNDIRHVEYTAATD